jgi:CRISPR/Cas system CMR-associated protein Cmr5 small subunit
MVCVKDHEGLSCSLKTRIRKDLDMVSLCKVLKSTATVLGISLCTSILAVTGPLLLLAFLASRWETTNDLTSVSTGQEALKKIESEHSGNIPKTATDFYYWDQGFLSDHTTYWSFTCKTISDCNRAASPVLSSFHSGAVLTDASFREWKIPEFDFIRSGPEYFGKKYFSDKWDLSRIRHGTSAVKIHYDSRDSELQFSAIDYDSLRVYRLRWFGSSLTNELNEIDYNPEKESDRPREAGFH